MTISPKEDIFYEGGPASSDLIINLMAGITLIGLPLLSEPWLGPCGLDTK